MKSQFWNFLAVAIVAISGSTAAIAINAQNHPQPYHAPPPPFSCQKHGGLESSKGPMKQDISSDQEYMVTVCKDGVTAWVGYNSP